MFGNVRIFSEGRISGWMGFARYVRDLRLMQKLDTITRFPGTRYEGIQFRRSLLDTIPVIGEDLRAGSAQSSFFSSTPLTSVAHVGWSASRQACAPSHSPPSRATAARTHASSFQIHPSVAAERSRRIDAPSLLRFRDSAVQKLGCGAHRSRVYPVHGCSA